MSGGVIFRGHLRRTARLLFAAACLAAAMPAHAAEDKVDTPSNTNAPTFVRLSPIVLPVVVGNEVTRQIGLNLALELEPGKTAESLGPNRRQVLDAFIKDLYSIYDQRRNATQALDYALIKQRLKDTVTRLVGPGIVREVLILQAYEHRL